MKEIIIFCKNNIDIISAILSAAITSLAGFFVAKYTHNKSIPLDKLEYVYDEVYYPIYKFINDKNNCNNIYLIKNSIKIYFDAYEKYLDFSTIKIYKELCNCSTESKQKRIYKRFYNNIYDVNIYLRKRLGYLEPNIFQLYKYSSAKDKALFNTIITLAITYILIIFSATFFKFLSSIAVTFLLIFIILLFIWFVLFLYDKFIS